MQIQKQSKTNSFISFVGLILLLIGIFMSVRTGANFVFFKKYPTTGVMFSFSSFYGGMPYSQREEDCIIYPQTYFKLDGQIRTATDDEKRMEEQQKKSCISGVEQARDNAKINDISSSLLFVFLGVGVLVGKKYI